jgi:SAM-dependent methyltransferase
MAKGRRIRDEIDRHLASMEALEELSDTRYHLTHERFEAASNQRRLLLDWVEGLTRRLSPPPGRPVDILSVGCGGGVMDRRIIDLIAKTCGPVHITGVDPNDEHIPAFQTAFNDSEHASSTFIGGFMDFDADRRFDLIYFLHSLYYFDAIEPALRKAAALLRPGGRLVAFQAPNSELNHLAHRVWKKQFDQPAWYSDDVRAILEVIPGTLRCERIEATVDVTPCFEPDNRLGIEILDFIVQAETQRFSPALRASLRSSLKSVCARAGDQFLVPHPIDVMTLDR